MDTPSRSRTPRSGGFTLVEVVVALVILSVGVLGLAGTTGLLVRQVSMSEVATERSVALQSVLEQLRSLPYDSVTAGHETVGRYSASWSVDRQGTNSLVVTVVTVGPGVSDASGFPRLAPDVSDTFDYRINRP